MNLRHIFPLEINYEIRHFFEFLNQKKIDINEKSLSAKKRVFFLDTPTYGNIGDQAIAFAMKKMVKDFLPDYEQIEVSEDKLPQSINWLKKNILPSDLICLTGGGNLGTLYPRYEGVRRLVLKNFKNNKIIIFPQTFDYENNLYGKWERYRAKKVYSACKNLTLCARDEHSYKIMEKEYNFCKVIFCPDIVLYLDYSNFTEKEENVGICLRNDKEAYISQELSSFIKNKFQEANNLYTTTDLYKYIDESNRKLIIEQKLKEFSKNKIVVTDRLHGVIFSYITNTPCIALPNSNGKIENVCSYLEKSGKVLFCKSIEDIENIHFTETNNESLKDRFNELVSLLKKNEE